MSPTNKRKPSSLEALSTQRTRVHHSKAQGSTYQTPFAPFDSPALAMRRSDKVFRTEGDSRLRKPIPALTVARPSVSSNPTIMRYVWFEDGPVRLSGTSERVKLRARQACFPQ